MRFLFTCLPGFGHFYPMVPLARAAITCGHQVTFASSATFCQDIYEHGFDAKAIGIDWKESEPELVFPEFVGANPSLRTELLTQVFAYHHPKAAVQDMLRVIRKWKPQCVVHDALEFAGQMAAEISDVPWAVLESSLVGGIFPAMLPLQPSERRWMRHLRRGPHSLGRLRMELGLRRVGNACQTVPISRKFLTLDLLPPSLHIFTARASAPTAYPLRPTLVDRGRDSTLPEHIPRHHRHLAHVTLGTVFGRSVELLKTVTAGLVRAGFDVTVAAGNLDARGLNDLSLTGAFVETWVRHDKLLPLCDLLVTHGGWSTLVAGLIHGLPMLVLPQGADQPRNAAMLQAVGAGTYMTSVSVERVADVACDLVQNPIYALNSRRIRAEIKAMPTPEHVVPLLCKLAANRRPIITRDKWGLRMLPSRIPAIRT